jgi:hypothetical protein
MQYSGRKSNDIKYIRVGYSLKLIGIGNGIDFPPKKKDRKTTFIFSMFHFYQINK